MALTRPKYSSILDTDFKVSCKVATTGSSITLSGGAPNTLDGQNLAVGDRILVRDQSPASENGVYVVNAVGTGSNGTWVRAKDFAASQNVTSGIMIPVTQGNTRGGRIYLLTTPDPITLNSTNLTFTDVTFSPEYGASITNSTAATNTTSGALTVTGGVGIGGNIYVGGNANISGTANITIDANIGGNLTVAGNLTVNGTTTTINTTTLDVEDLNITVAKGAINAAAANGAGLTVDGAGVTWIYNSSSNTWVSNVGANITGTINVTGNANVGNLGTAELVVTGVSNLNSISNVKITGGSSNQFIQTDGLGNLSFVSLSPSSIFNGNSNVSVAANSNVTVSVAGNANVVTITGTGANIAGTLDVTGNANVGNILAGGFYYSNGSPFTVDSTQIVNGNSNVKVAANSNVTVSVAGNANIITVTGTGANVSGTFDVTGNATVGNLLAGNVFFSNGQPYNRYFASSSAPSNPTNGDFWYDTDDAVLYVRIGDGLFSAWLDISSSTNIFNDITANTANITSTLNVVGNANTGNLGTGTIIATTANLTTINSGLMQNGNSNVTIAANSNVTISAIGNANVFTVTGTGANIAGTANVTGDVIAGINLVSNYSSGDEGGEIKLALPQTNTTLSGSVTIDINQNRLRIFESGGTNRGGYIDLTAASAGVGSNLLAGGGGGSFTFTANTTAPTSPNLGDQWYDTAADILFTRINDGSGNLWLDISSTGNTFAAITASNATVTSNLTVGNINLSGAITDSAQLDIQTSASNSNIVLNPHGTGSIVVTKNLLPNANATLSLGNSSLRFANIWGLASSAQYADLAEKYLADESYAPGTVVIFGGNAEITVTTQSHDSRVAGVISTEPAYLMNDNEHQGNLWLPVALTGRVPCQVQGPIKKGDVLVSSNTAGVAEKLDKSRYEPGCVIGKSLENHMESTIKTIEVVVGRF